MTRKTKNPLHAVPPPLYEDDDPGNPERMKASQPESFASVEPSDGRSRRTPWLLSSSDQDVAQEVIHVLTERHGAQPVFDEEQLWRYDGAGLWEPQPDEETRNLVCSWNGVQVVDADGNGKVRKDGTPILFAGNQRTAESARLRTNDICKRKGFFESPEIGVMFKDAFVRVTSEGDVVKSAPGPECRARFRIDAPYPENPFALPDEYIDVMFQAFTGDTPEDALAKIALIQEWFGLALIGRSPNARALFLVGPERSGKSVTAKIGLGVFPPGVRTAMSLKALDPSGVSATQASYFLAQLSMSRINADLDLPGGSFVGGENFKKIVTGEGMTGRQPAGRAFQFTPRVAMLFAGESLPNPEDKNRGFFRRWLVVRYHHQVDSKSVVQNYEEKILAKERATIAAWFIQGAAASIKRGGFAIPAAVDNEINAWIMEVDPATQFCKQHCEEAPNLPREKWLKTAELCEKFNTWAVKYGYKTRSPIGFGRDLKRNLSLHLTYVDEGKSNRWGYRYVESGIVSNKTEEKW